MNLPLSLLLGLRYTRAKRRNHFISFISLTCIGGVALGVLALITVLSVMNGFQTELRNRILAMVPQGTIYGAYETIDNWEGVLQEIQQRDDVHGVAPFIQGQGMLTHRGAVRGVSVLGILPEHERTVSKIVESSHKAVFETLAPGAFNVILGQKLANRLGLSVGDKVNLMIPEASVSPAGILPRFKRFMVSGTFEIGYEFDSSLAYIHLDDAAKLYRLGKGVTGLHLNFGDLFAAPRLSREIAKSLEGYYFVSDWTREHGNFFSAIKLEKTIMFIMLLLIIAVAAFNIVSTLVMVVADKKSEIAILRTLGATPGFVLRVFVIQGGVIGVTGTLIGLVLGVLLALNVTELVAAIEQVFQVQFLSADIYYISYLPSELRWGDVVKICMISLLMSLLATIYPAWRASKVQPAEALRYE